MDNKKEYEVDNLREALELLKELPDGVMLEITVQKGAEKQ